MPRNDDESTLLNLRAATGPISRENIDVDVEARRAGSVSGDVCCVSDGLRAHFTTIFVSDGLDVSDFAVSAVSCCKSELDGLGCRN
jgi:hypothetical protein